ncbi:MAG TPA: putative ABC transporter permease [Negativicutes bacterium]|nr:putative ABC transporter permease [Negativicutes bacterium]
MVFIETIFLWFAIYSTIGWIYETILCSVKQKRFINRGFLNGPYCPIYGCGAVLDILLLGKISNPVLLFLAAALLTGALEYFTSLTMETIFHARWWDYSDKKFNINGRVYLTGVIAFGTFSLVLILFLHPAVSAHTSMLSETLRSFLALFIFSVLLIDTVYTVTKFSEFEEVLQEITNRIGDAVQSAKTLYGRAFTTFNGKIKAVNSQVGRMILSFPKLKSIHYEEGLKKLRELIKTGKDGDAF